MDCPRISFHRLTTTNWCCLSFRAYLTKWTSPLTFALCFPMRASTPCSWTRTPNWSHCCWRTPASLMIVRSQSHFTGTFVFVSTSFLYSRCSEIKGSLFLFELSNKGTETSTIWTKLWCSRLTLPFYLFSTRQLLRGIWDGLEGENLPGFCQGKKSKHVTHSVSPKCLICSYTLHGHFIIYTVKCSPAHQNDEWILSVYRLKLHVYYSSHCGIVSHSNCLILR